MLAFNEKVATRSPLSSIERKASVKQNRLLSFSITDQTSNFIAMDYQSGQL